MNVEVAEVLLSSDEVCVLTGITYRQLDWWVRNEVLQPTIEAHGSGNPRRWSPDVLPALAVLGRLSDTLERLPTGVARRVFVAAYSGRSSVKLDGGFTLKWEFEWPA